MFCLVPDELPREDSGIQGAEVTLWRGPFSAFYGMGTSFFIEPRGLVALHLFLLVGSSSS